MEMPSLPEEPGLGEKARADVCVVGAGIAGMTTAYLLAQYGKSVLVVDDGPVGGGETGRTTAHLSNALDDRYMEIERLHGNKGAKLAAESHTAAVALIESIVAAEGISCDFRRVNGYLFVPPGDSLDIFDRELEAAHRAGLDKVQKLDRAPLRFFDTGPCLLFPEQGQFHPLKYLEGLHRAILRMGGHVYTNTRARSISGGREAHVDTSGGAVITADHIVVATNTPVNDLVAIHTKQAPYRTYVIGARIPTDSVPAMLLWDTPDPYHYVRIHPFGSYDILIVGGEDHKTGQQDDGKDRWNRLESWARERFPMIESIEYCWSGQVMEPVDYLAFIGRNPLDADNVFIATGDSGHGMTHGTIAGMMLSEMIMGRPHRWESLYNPSRVSLRAAGEFTRENVNVAGQYLDWLTPGEVDSADQIPPGSGAVLRAGLSKHAVFRDEGGIVHTLSAVCKHLGCFVRWNPTEKTWDCPCHGSRYDAYGKVVTGPARDDLEEISSGEPEEVRD